MRQLLTLFVALTMISACTGQNISSLAPASGGEEAPAAEAHGEAAAEGGEGHEKKKPDEKPKPDSVISSVLSLPVVKQWSEYMDSKDDGRKLVAWGEYIKDVQGAKCWSIVVAEENAKGADTIWKRFCMQQTGLEIWVETTLGAKSSDETNYISYDKWATSCNPTYNSPGTC